MDSPSWWRPDGPELPSPVQDAVRSHLDQILRRATGEVLDLGGWPHPHRSLPFPDVVRSITRLEGLPVAPSARYDTIVCCARLPSAPDLPAALGALRASLRTGGLLLWVEPVRRAGWHGLVRSVVGSVRDPLPGWHVDRDLPAAVRAAGLVNIAVDHFWPRSRWPFDHWVAAIARHAPTE